MNIQREIVAYLLATYDLTDLDLMTRFVGAGKTLSLTDNPITLCLAESHYFIPALQEAYNVKKAQFKVLNADFSKKLNQFLLTKPAQKPIKKQSIVCSIAAKLAKSGVKNPMRVAWKLYRITMDCLHASKDVNTFKFFAQAFNLEFMIMQLGILPSHILPPAVLKVFANNDLVFA